MTQLSQLTDFIEANLPQRALVPFTSDMDDISLLPCIKVLGHGQLCTQVRKYTAFLRWDAWPYREWDPDLLFSLVESWLADNAGELREILVPDAPSIDVEVDDENAVAWVEISLPLVDPIVLIEDENGPIPRGGKRYRLGKPDIWVAQAHRIHCGIVP
ncbi:TPA: phage tail protein [Yersinia enterocolitica]|nr:phage tail protein [Yersinia enterocolitica]HDL6643406.1 phage tail protein [Yersinia enterocolitica]HDL7169194.1 phage tail protein [Yersinia enterocolitica]HDL7379966.1 phage tail protein [Yersinia enterocolitica]HDL7632445.1 phage tail protein [Yersinia enterocolitica]